MFFSQVFTVAQQLADSYEKLCRAGCLLFSEWKLTLYCQRLAGKVSVHVDFGVGNTKLLAGTKSLLKEIEALREFMKKCLIDWREHMDTQRGKAYHLNYYSTDQLVRLRQDLAIFKKGSPTSLDSQVFALLRSVKSNFSLDEITETVHSVIGPPNESSPQSSAQAQVAASAQDEKAEETPVEDAAQKKIRTKLKQNGYANVLISAAFEGLGTGKQLKDYKKWIKQNQSKVTDTVFQRKQSQKEVKQGLVSGIVDEQR